MAGEIDGVGAARVAEVGTLEVDPDEPRSGALAEALSLLAGGGGAVTGDGSEVVGVGAGALAEVVTGGAGGAGLVEEASAGAASPGGGGVATGYGREGRMKRERGCSDFLLLRLCFRAALLPCINKRCGKRYHQNPFPSVHA